VDINAIKEELPGGMQSLQVLKVANISISEIKKGG
jgi:hypothetical protein